MTREEAVAAIGELLVNAIEDGLGGLPLDDDPAVVYDLVTDIIRSLTPRLAQAVREANAEADALEMELARELCWI